MDLGTIFIIVCGTILLIMIAITIICMEIGVSLLDIEDKAIYLIREELFRIKEKEFQKPDYDCIYINYMLIKYEKLADKLLDTVNISANKAKKDEPILTIFKYTCIELVECIKFRSFIRKEIRDFCYGFE